MSQFAWFDLRTKDAKSAEATSPARMVRVLARMKS